MTFYQALCATKVAQAIKNGLKLVRRTDAIVAVFERFKIPKQIVNFEGDLYYVIP